MKYFILVLGEGKDYTDGLFFSKEWHTYTYGIGFSKEWVTRRGFLKSFLFSPHLFKQKKNLPGQFISWHDLISRWTPMQSFPPNDGRGSEHVRTRCCVPVPHVFEHGSQSFQVLHSPSTKELFKGLLSMNAFQCLDGDLRVLF